MRPLVHCSVRQKAANSGPSGRWLVGGGLSANKSIKCESPTGHSQHWVAAMQTQNVIETPFKHPGTGRLAAVVRTSRFLDLKPLVVASGRYLLFIASERVAQLSNVATARSWINAGASYVCAWGINSPEIEESFDYATFLPEFGDPLPFTLMTASSTDEPLEEALWFAFYNGELPDEPCDGACPVVVVVDSESLEKRSIAWVQENAE